MHVDEKLTAFLALEAAIRAVERPEDRGGREIKLDKLSRRSKNLLDFVIRQFHLIFGTAE